MAAAGENPMAIDKVAVGTRLRRLTGALPFANEQLS
jgi:hypothetical protein